MRNIIKTLALVTTGLVVGAVAGRVKIKTYTITNLDDELLVDIDNENIISHESVKVYADDKLT